MSSSLSLSNINPVSVKVAMEIFLCIYTFCSFWIPHFLPKFVLFTFGYNVSECRGKLRFTEQSDKNGVAEGLNDIKRTGFTDSPKKISVIPKTFKRGSHPKGISKIPHSSRPATSLGCSSVQSCSNSAIAFSKQQMHGIECIAMKLTKELKSMKDIMDDMLRSEFCLNTSLRYKVNEVW